MRTHPILFLIIGLTLSACDDPVEAGSGGTLAVSTSTAGDDPDHDGYQLTIDGVDSLALAPSGTDDIDLPAGRHTLRLLDVESHCSVAPEAPLTVDVLPGSTTPVAFEINCPGTGIRLTAQTTGLDLDADGYRVVVDGRDLAGVRAQGSVYTRLDPGSRTITLSGLAPNCAMDGLAAHTITVTDAEVVPIEFAVVCTATSGVIGVTISQKGVGAEYEARLDGATLLSVAAGDRAYFSGVPEGDHVVSLEGPPVCSVETAPQSVAVSVGSLVRDTVEVTFLTSCETTLQISVRTSGSIPSSDYSVWLCRDVMDDCYWGPSDRLGAVAPNGILVVPVDPGLYWLYLMDLPSACFISSSYNPRRDISISEGDVRSVLFTVRC